MKLQKFQERNPKKKGLLIFSICCVFLIAGVFLYQSFALFQAKENFNVLNGNIEDPGDLYFAYYVEDKITQDMPAKDSGYTLSEKSFCNNGVTILWDEERWGAFVDYTGYKKENSSRTKCTLYFEEKKEPPKPSDEVKDYIIANVTEDQIILDDETVDHNMRFIGANPNNYIDIGDRDADGNVILWRIIGAMNNIKSSEEDEVGETRLKIRRAEKVDAFVYDVSSGGYGLNEWSRADLMKLLNPGYEANPDLDLSGNVVNNSLYWNSAIGKCYTGERGTSAYGYACDFSSTGLSEKAKEFIGDAVWNLGSNEVEIPSGKGNESTTIKFYDDERSNNTGRGCSVGTYCRKEAIVTRSTKWTGRVGLIYPSDYGYATSGGKNTDRNTCINSSLVSYFSLSDCKNNNWLYYSGNVQWTMMPARMEASEHVVYTIYTEGHITSARGVTISSAVFPTVYLKANIQITEGNGSFNSPFVVR